MKYLYLFIVLTVTGCDTRVDHLELQNQAPLLEFSNKENTWSTDDEYRNIYEDSAKVGKNYILSYKLTEEQTYTNFTVSGYQGYGWWNYNDSSLTEVNGLENGEHTMSYYANNSGNLQVLFNLLDSYGKESVGTLNLKCFENLLPVARLDVNLLGAFSPYEYKIDGTESYDRDTEFGGGILHYQFIIDSDTTLYPNAKMNYIFPGPGSYVVGLRVMDNDSAWSQSSEINYNVN